MAIGVPTSIGAVGVTGVTGTSIVLTTTASVTAGDSIVVMFVDESTSRPLTGVTDSAGNTYAIDVSRNGSSVHVAVASCHNAIALPSGGTITGSFASTGVSRALLAMTLTGLAPTGAKDQTASNNSNTAAWNSAATAALSQADEIGIYAVTSSANTANTPDGGWVDVHDSALIGTRRTAFGYQIVASAAALTASGTLAAANWAAVLVTYKAFIPSSAPPLLVTLPFTATP